MRWPIIIGVFVWSAVNLLSSAASNKTIRKRQKRYLLFEKGSAYTIQVNNAKGILSGSPRGLNEIYEFTLSYDLPTDLQFYEDKRKPLATTTTSTTEYPYIQYYPKYPLDPNVYQPHRKYWKLTGMSPLKCKRWNFQQFYGKPKKICLQRTKRFLELKALKNTQRLFYDIIEMWSKIQGYSPRYCFMRVLCEAPHLLMQKGHSLLHDLIRILLRFTTSWAWYHKTFGRALKNHYRLDECAALYGPLCRISWLDHVTTEVHGPEFSII